MKGEWNPRPPEHQVGDQFTKLWELKQGEHGHLTEFICDRHGSPEALPDLYFDLFSYPVASIVFGDIAIVTLFLL